MATQTPEPDITDPVEATATTTAQRGLRIGVLVTLTVAFLAMGTGGAAADTVTFGSPRTTITTPIAGSGITHCNVWTSRATLTPWVLVNPGEWAAVRYRVVEVGRGVRYTSSWSAGYANQWGVVQVPRSFSDRAAGYQHYQIQVQAARYTKSSGWLYSNWTIPAHRHTGGVGYSGSLYVDPRQLDFLLGDRSCLM